MFWLGVMVFSGRRLLMKGLNAGFGECCRVARMERQSR